MSASILRRTSTASFRDTAPAFRFFYTKAGNVFNEKTQKEQAAMVDAGSSVTIIPDQDMVGYSQKRLVKAMIEKFRHLNNGHLPTFRFEILGQIEG